MSLENILFLALVIGAMILFAAVLAYGDWATRQAMREIAESRPCCAKNRQTIPAHAANSAPDYEAAA